MNVRKASCTERFNVLFLGACEGACQQSTFTTRSIFDEDIYDRGEYTYKEYLSVLIDAVIHTLLCELLF